jgi:hypothetical protein
LADEEATQAMEIAADASMAGHLLEEVDLVADQGASVAEAEDLADLVVEALAVVEQAVVGKTTSLIFAFPCSAEPISKGQTKANWVLHLSNFA